MPLGSGARLGPYEIVSPLGAGGMGEVYKARDTRLNRTVAIKILPAVLAADPLFRDRFEREARTIASLTHPHISTLYDVGRADGIDYLVMELLQGETLADRLGRSRDRPLPIGEALRIAVEIADALDRAHRANVTHRDLKPGNVMLTGVRSKPPNRLGRLDPGFTAADHVALHLQTDDQQRAAVIVRRPNVGVCHDAERWTRYLSATVQRQPSGRATAQTERDVAWDSFMRARDPGRPARAPSRRRKALWVRCRCS